MLLSDREIIKALRTEEIIITPILNARKQIGSSSIDVRLGTEFKIIRRSKQDHFDLENTDDEISSQIKQYTELVRIAPLEAFYLHPGEFALGCTLEYIVLPPDIAGALDGRSTWGRAGLQVHSTAGFIDPGFEGTITFELQNTGKLPLPLYAGARIAQISFYRCQPVMQNYALKSGAKYARSTEIKDTMFYREYEYQKIRRIRNPNNANV